MPLPSRNFSRRLWLIPDIPPREMHMNSVIYLVGLVVVVLAILSFLGLQ